MEDITKEHYLTVISLELENNIRHAALYQNTNRIIIKFQNDVKYIMSRKMPKDVNVKKWTFDIITNLNDLKSQHIIDCNEIYDNYRKHKISTDVFSICICLDHSVIRSREYKKSNVICDDCCDGYCEDCSFHNGHINQQVDGEFPNCLYTIKESQGYRPSKDATKCYCENGM